MSVRDFLSDLSAIALPAGPPPPAGPGSHFFHGRDGDRIGCMQIVVHSVRLVTIHRLQAMRPGRGVGAAMLKAVCDLADRHGVELRLRPLPFGPKPYPMDRDQLRAWYERHGFEGARRKMVRRPIPRPE